MRVKNGTDADEKRAQPQEAVFTRNFVLVCLTSFASFMALQFLLPTLPLYLKDLGGQDTDIGLIFGVYSLAALGSRFVSGPMLDMWGRKWPLFAGALLYLVAMLMYSLTSTVTSVILLRFFHGIGFGIATTACSALAADLAPSQRRGEALGWYGTFASVAMAIGPGVGLWLIAIPGLPASGFPLLFLVCDAVVALELLFALLIREPNIPAFKRPSLFSTLSPTSIVCREAFPIASAMLFGAFSSGAILSFTPVYFSTEDTGIVPFFFLCYATVMTLSRPFVGMLADRFDRRLVAIPLMAFCSTGVGALAIAPTLEVALLSATLFGLGYGSLNATLLALVVDLVKPHQRGAAMGTFMASIDVGIAFGSMILGFVAQMYGYRWAFLVAGAVSLVGVLYLIVFKRLSRCRRIIKQ